VLIILGFNIVLSSILCLEAIVEPSERSVTHLDIYTVRASISIHDINLLLTVT
jgi:hypothetical protein